MALVDVLVSAPNTSCRCVHLGVAKKVCRGVEQEMLRHYARHRFCPMPDIQFSDLTCGQIFTADGILYIKTDVGMSAVALTGPTCGQAKTLLPIDFVELQHARDLQPLNDLADRSTEHRDLQPLNDLADRSTGRPSLKFHPDFQQTIPCTAYFIGSDGFAYAYDAIAAAIQARHPDLQGAAAYTQLEVLGLDGPFRGGQTPFAIPATFF